MKRALVPLLLMLAPAVALAVPPVAELQPDYFQLGLTGDRAKFERLFDGDRIKDELFTTEAHYGSFLAGFYLHCGGEWNGMCDFVLPTSDPRARMVVLSLWELEVFDVIQRQASFTGGGPAATWCHFRFFANERTKAWLMLVEDERKRQMEATTEQMRSLLTPLEREYADRHPIVPKEKNELREAIKVIYGK